ncbi:MAG: hypothetical protein ABI321_22935 [Polyangia bacterium]
MTQPRDVQVVDDVALTTSGDTVIVLHKGPARIPPFTAMCGHIDALVASGHPSVLVLQFVLPTSSPPDGKTRAFTYSETKRVRAHLHCIVTVALGDDLWTSIVRTVLRGMSTVGGLHGIHFVEKSQEDGFTRLRSKASSNTPSEAALRQITASLYAALDLPYPP